MTNEFPKSRFSVAGLGISEDARKTMNAAIDAFSDWREDMAESSEKNSKAVFDQMATAAKAFGWPAEFVEMSRQHMQTASKMQVQMMDLVMDVWVQQLKNPGGGFKMPEAWAGAMKSMPNVVGMPGMGQFPQMPGMPNFGSFPGMSGFPGFPGFPGMPGMPGMGSMPINPMQFWMQAAEMWQKSWQQAMQSWMDTQSTMTGGKGK